MGRRSRIDLPHRIGLVRRSCRMRHNGGGRLVYRRIALCRAWSHLGIDIVRRCIGVLLHRCFRRFRSAEGWFGCRCNRPNRRWVWPLGRMRHTDLRRRIDRSGRLCRKRRSVVRWLVDRRKRPHSAEVLRHNRILGLCSVRLWSKACRKHRSVGHRGLWRHKDRRSLFVWVGKPTDNGCCCKVGPSCMRCCMRRSGGDHDPQRYTIHRMLVGLSDKLRHIVQPHKTFQGGRFFHKFRNVCSRFVDRCIRFRTTVGAKGIYNDCQHRKVHQYRAFVDHRVGDCKRPRCRRKKPPRAAQ